MFDIVSCMVVDVVQYPICNVTRRVRRHVLDDSSALSNSPARKEVFFFSLSLLNGFIEPFRFTLPAKLSAPMVSHCIMRNLRTKIAR